MRGILSYFTTVTHLINLDVYFCLAITKGGFRRSSTLRAAGGVIWDVTEGGNVAADRGWTQEDEVGVGSWKEHGAVNQRFKLELLADLGISTSPCN